MFDLISKFLNQPAKRCSRCGSEIFRLTPAGALCCVACSPGESVAVLIARNAGDAKQGLRWELENENDQVCETANPETFGGDGPGGAGGFEAGFDAGGFGPQGGAAAVASGVAAWCGGNGNATAGSDSSRVDPDSPPDALVIVSTRLDWFTAPLGSVWGRGDMEICGKVKGWPPVGAYRPLEQIYFGWLVGQVESLRASGKLRGQDLDDARDELAVIAFTAVGAGVLGEWALDSRRWPTRAPGGYAGPVVSRGEFRLIAWD